MPKKITKKPARALTKGFNLLSVYLLIIGSGHNPLIFLFLELGNRFLDFRSDFASGRVGHEIAQPFQELPGSLGGIDFLAYGHAERNPPFFQPRLYFVLVGLVENQAVFRHSDLESRGGRAIQALENHYPFFPVVFRHGEII